MSWRFAMPLVSGAEQASAGGGRSHGLGASTRASIPQQIGRRCPILQAQPHRRSAADGTTLA